MLGEVFLGSLVAVAVVLLLVTSLHLDLHSSSPPKLLRPFRISPDFPNQPPSGIAGDEAPKSAVKEDSSGLPSSSQSPSSSPTTRREIPNHYILGLTEDDFRRSGVDAMMARYQFATAEVAGCDADFGEH